MRVGSGGGGGSSEVSVAFLVLLGVPSGFRGMVPVFPFAFFFVGTFRGRHWENMSGALM